MKEALEEELRSRIATALESKINESKDDDEDGEDEDDDDDDEDDLAEVSAAKLGAYVNKASKDSDASWKARDKALDNDDTQSFRKLGVRTRKRDMGVDRAVDKLKGNRHVKVPAGDK
jgi:hypothetical protein